MITQAGVKNIDLNIVERGLSHCFECDAIVTLNNGTKARTEDISNIYALVFSIEADKIQSNLGWNIDNIKRIFIEKRELSAAFPEKQINKVLNNIFYGVHSNNRT